MTNLSIHNCNNCQHLQSRYCTLRNEDIDIPFFTTCGNWNTSTPVPIGIKYSLVTEVTNRVVSYVRLPYYNGWRADTFRNGYNDSYVVIVNNELVQLTFKNVRAYLDFYENKHKKKKNYILGALIGDMIGSVFEFHNYKSTDFHLFGDKTTFSDDSVLTMATMDVILNKLSYETAYQAFGRKYTNRGYSGTFLYWIYMDDPEPYLSLSNGSAMRVSPVGWAYDTLDEVLKQAKRSAEVSHSHPEGIKGAQATASAVFLARTGKSKAQIKEFINVMFGYDLDRSIRQIRPGYSFDVSCEGSVPEAIIAFLESTDFESAIRLAVSIGGDSDTIACIAGAVAEAFYNHIPEFIIDNTLSRLPEEFISLIGGFSERYRKLE